MIISTEYLGLKLTNPFICGASYLTKNAEKVKRLEDAGIGAVVLPSLFEEQITKENSATINEIEAGAEAFGEALSYLPEPETLKMGHEPYLEELRKIKEAVSVPVIASLNGYSLSGWTNYAKLLEEAGADAIELNVYFPPVTPETTAKMIEDKVVAITKAVTSVVKIPVSVKLSSQFTSVADIGVRLVYEAKAKGLVLFNRFLYPEIDIDNLSMKTELNLSTRNELPHRLAWLGILYGNIKATLAATGGVHTAEDVIKSIMVGADAVQIVSALVENGVEYLPKLKLEFTQWLEQNGHENLTKLKGSMSLEKTPNPEAYQRLNYARLLKSWLQDS